MNCNFRYNLFYLALTVRQMFVLCLIRIEKFSNVDRSIHFLSLFLGIFIFIISLFFKLLFYRSLGRLATLCIWLNNPNNNSTASWFLQYVVVRDLQTMENFHFICQQLLRAEKRDRSVR